MVVDDDMSLAKFINMLLKHVALFFKEIIYFCLCAVMATKVLAKLGNIVEEANFSQFSRPGNILRMTETILSAWKQENVYTSGQKRFCFPDTDFAFETYVSQFIRNTSNGD